jgi:hypothetical protein
VWYPYMTCIIDYHKSEYLCMAIRRQPENQLLNHVPFFCERLELTDLQKFLPHTGHVKLLIYLGVFGTLANNRIHVSFFIKVQLS